VDLLTRNDKEALFKLCFNRCHAALSVMCEYEKAKLGSLWDFDARYRDQTPARLTGGVLADSFQPKPETTLHSLPTGGEARP